MSSVSDTIGTTDILCAHIYFEYMLYNSEDHRVTLERDMLNTSTTVCRLLYFIAIDIEVMPIGTFSLSSGSNYKLSEENK